METFFYQICEAKQKPQDLERIVQCANEKLNYVSSPTTQEQQQKKASH